MESKRQSDQQEGDESGLQILANPSKRRREDSQQSKTFIIGNFRSLFHLTSDDIVPPVKDLVQRLVREVFDQLIPSATINQTRSRAKFYELVFKNELHPKIYTFSKIKTKDDTLVEIALYDIRTQTIVTDGPLSSIKIEICVLNGDFSDEDWTADEFKSKISRPRNNKGQLLKGDKVITLKNGVGYITEKIVFTDNSSWTRSKSFRLGVKIVKSNPIEADIREGRSEPFKVLDNRGVAYKKHDLPSLNDEVWRLKKIAKGGILHEKLSSLEIKTVKDLLRLYITNQASLLEKIGKVGARSLDKIIEHAKGCDVNNDERYIYQAAEPLTFLVFNCIYEVVEVALNGQNFRSLQSLNLEEKRLVERVKQEAYKNLKDVVALETTTQDLMKTLTWTGVQAAQYGAPDQGPPQFDFPISQQGLPETWPYMCQASTSTSIIDEAARIDQDGSAEGQLISFDDGNGWVGSVSQIDEFASFFRPINHLVQANPFPYTCDDGAECSNRSSLPNNSAMHVSSKGKRKTVWHKIRSALKWVILHVAKRKAKPFHRQ